MESNDKLEQLLKHMYAEETLHDDEIDTSDIIDEEWTKFEATHFGGEKRKVKSDKFSFLKIAAMFIGVLMLGGIAFATIHIISSGSQKADEVQTVATENAQRATSDSQLAKQDSALYNPIVYESAELVTILDDEVEPVYRKEATKHIRLYFTWDKKRSIDEIIDTFNKFERINITRYNKILIVE